jgi:hypothetical protein
VRSDAIDYGMPLYVSPAGVELIAFEARLRYAAQRLTW